MQILLKVELKEHKFGFKLVLSTPRSSIYAYHSMTVRLACEEKHKDKCVSDRKPTKNLS